MKKLLMQFDTDPHPSVFDTVVAYDGGADHVVGYGGIHAANVSALVEGAIFTRAPKDKHNTAIFIGGSNLEEGQLLFNAVQNQFFANFRVSIMLDSNGSNTTAAAMVAKLLTSGSLAGKQAVILGGTGPVGQRAAVMLAREGAAEIRITSRHLAKAEQAAAEVRNRFGIEVIPVTAADLDARASAIEHAEVVVATGATGVELLKPEHWQHNAKLELIADTNATPPLGIGGIELSDRGAERCGKKVWGAIGFGPLKLALHRACIGKLFESNQQVLDAEEILAIAKTMA